MPNTGPEIAPIEIGAHCYTAEDWEADTSGTIAAVVSGISTLTGPLDKSLRGIPHYSPELPVGTIYQADGELKVVAGKLMTPNEVRRLKGLPAIGESPIGTIKRLMHEAERKGVVSDERHVHDRVAPSPAWNPVGEAGQEMRLIGTLLTYQADGPAGEAGEFVYAVSEESLPLDEAEQPPRWRSVVQYSRNWKADADPPQRRHAPFPARALRSQPGVAPFLAFDE